MFLVLTFSKVPTSSISNCKSFKGFLLERSRTNTQPLERSICLRNSRPIPLSNDAPCIIPGISATVKTSCPKPKETVPIVGLSVVNCQCPIFGFAFEILFSIVDFPALGKPMSPRSAMLFNSNKKCCSNPFLPGLENLGFLIKFVKKCMLPSPPWPPFSRHTGFVIG
ncbi:hypothetical protein AWRI1631_82190 [Saccharomyces cerevisiae AWRI1631]|uniref:Uncharacterized protein n=1 Tax=Saccharomyces cerevisiae (strain AWRI1631) TaxID=545124 RepID=B5VK95_YEAS6|nr:hypothetical protein AWRI1631_82190 [Saccharomyces cerevisiae AWRI1631]